MSKQESEAVPFRTVLRAELEHIEDSREKRGVKTRLPHNPDPRDRARKGNLLGLAFSGGGIRSATFNLGVLQGLAEHDVLKEVDYLSTVSGGGYIGAWFISLLRANAKQEQVGEVQEALKQAHARHPEHSDQDSIHVLRQFSNYLTPRIIFYSADVWTMVASWTRNTLLNLTLLVATIAVPLLMARALGYWFFVNQKYTSVDSWALGGTILFLLIAAYCVGANLLNTQELAPIKPYIRSFDGWKQWQIQIFVVVPLLIAGLFVAHWLRNAPGNLGRDDAFWASITPAGLLLFVCYMAISLCGGLLPCFCQDHPGMKVPYLWGFLLALLASLVPAFVVSALLWCVAISLHNYDLEEPWLLLTLGPPATLLGLALGEIVQLGIIGREFTESAREWFSRLRGWTLIYSCAWLIVFSASIYGPLWLEKLWNSHPWTGAGLTGTWVATTIGGLLSAKSKNASGKSDPQEGGGGSRNTPLELIARVAPFVFMIGFILAISWGVHFLVTWDLDPPPPQPAATDQTGKLQVTKSVDNMVLNVQVPSGDHPKTPLVYMIERYFWATSFPGPLICYDCPKHFLAAPVNLLLVCAAVVILLAFRLDINVFSLHEFYKNRLVRCYLGAARWKKRTADKFTGFDENDDVHLKLFHSRDRNGHYYGPYPIINATMNVSTGENLAWQQRKSIPFTFAPLYSGYNVEGGNEAMRLDETPDDKAKPRYAYRRTEDYCYPKGIHLGTAVAVSGAATSPNQGYHTSTAVAFLMTVFDVRLGWWVGNPRQRKRRWWLTQTYRRATPRFNLSAIASELFGISSAESGYVNLSDGGHFDNMGLYELVRRRCRYIIVSDAEQDPGLTFASMTSVIRNCRMDFGVEIKIPLDRIVKDEKGNSRTHCVVGRIEYPEDQDEGGSYGYLLYIKSSLTGDEPADVTGYHTEYPEFPHQTTANQWFTESQFESYRRLGFHIANAALGPARESIEDREEYFKDLEAVWYPPSEREERYTAEHALRFSELIQSIGDEDRLSFLDPQVFDGWSERELNAWQRKAKYQVSALIDFMNLVYHQLNLASKSERDQPHNQGWLKIFEHWVKQPDFEETWRRAQRIYEPRFRDFYDDLRKRKGSRD